MPNEMHCQAYVEEAVNLLGEMESALEGLADNLSDMDLMDRAFRILHTLSGASGMFGFLHVAEFAGEVEDVFLKARLGKHPVNGDLLVLGREACGHLRSLMMDGPSDENCGSGEVLA